VVAASLAVAVSVPLDLVPWLRGPAPYPPEWQWAFRPGGPSRTLLAAAACAALLLSLLGASGTGWARRHSRVASRVLVAGAVLLAWGFQLALLAREPGSPLATALSRTRSRSFTSHHAVAVSEDARDPIAFLRRHAELLPTHVRSAKHSATHPPGPVLFYRAALAACERSAALRETLLAAAGREDPDSPPPPARPAWAAALLGALALGLLGAATAWPVFHLARELGASPLAASRVAILWGLLPGPALMTPQFDQALALPVAGATLLMLRAALDERRGPRLAGLAGALGGLCVFTSYGAAAFLAVCGAAALVAAPPGGRESSARAVLGRRVGLALVGGTVTAAVAFALPALLGHRPLRAMATALSIHREVYTAPRSYALWLLFNPLDLALFLGLPVALTLLLRSVLPGERGALVTRFRLALLGGLALLVLAGVTRGEVGRLWIPLMPALLASSLVTGVEGPSRREALGQGALLALLTLVIAGYWIV